MNDNTDDYVQGSGNVFQDLERKNASLEQARALIAAKIVHILNAKKLSTREAEKLTGVAHTEFSRIRNARLSRFTMDRMISILSKLDSQIEVNISFKTTPRIIQDGFRA